MSNSTNWWWPRSVWAGGAEKEKEDSTEPKSDRAQPTRAPPTHMIDPNDLNRAIQNLRRRESPHRKRTPSPPPFHITADILNAQIRAMQAKKHPSSLPLKKKRRRRRRLTAEEKERKAFIRQKVPGPHSEVFTFPDPRPPLPSPIWATPSSSFRSTPPLPPVPSSPLPPGPSSPLPPDPSSALEPVPPRAPSPSVSPLSFRQGSAWSSSSEDEELTRLVNCPRPIQLRPTPLRPPLRQQLRRTNSAPNLTFQ